MLDETKKLKKFFDMTNFHGMGLNDDGEIIIDFDPFDRYEINAHIQAKEELDDHKKLTVIEFMNDQHQQAEKFFEAAKVFESEIFVSDVTTLMINRIIRDVSANNVTQMPGLEDHNTWNPYRDSESMFRNMLNITPDTAQAAYDAETERLERWYYICLESRNEYLNSEKHQRNLDILAYYHYLKDNIVNILSNVDFPETGEEANECFKRYTQKG